jgi:fructose-1,6-bisphosphatase I
MVTQSADAMKLDSKVTITTVQQHILHEQRKHSPQATGSFSWLLSGITLATKMTQARVRRAGLLDVVGAAGGTNVQGEEQQKLDVYADQALMHCLGVRENVAIMASEENEEAVTFDGRSGPGKYVVLFDPLDGSSNIDVNVSVGTIFSILNLPAGMKPDSDPTEAVLQPGVKQLAAGYVVYGSSTILVYTTGHGVHGFTLDPSIGAYVLSHENIRMPPRGKYYSCNDAYWDSFPEQYRRYITSLRRGESGQSYALRYIGSLVADFHRTLLKGGIFLYPPTDKNPGGKLRLLYEANPVAFIAEQAGGAATDGRRRILEIPPTEIHQRVPMIVGGKMEMEDFQRCCQEAAPIVTGLPPNQPSVASSPAAHSER